MGGGQGGKLGKGLGRSSFGRPLKASESLGPSVAPDDNVVFFFRGPYIPFKGNIGDDFKVILRRF